MNNQIDSIEIMSQKGASLLEFALIAALLVIGIALIMPSTEESVAGRVNCARGQYQNYDIADPGTNNPLDGCP